MTCAIFTSRHGAVSALPIVLLTYNTSLYTYMYIYTYLSRHAYGFLYLHIAMQDNMQVQTPEPRVTHCHTARHIACRCFPPTAYIFRPYTRTPCPS